MKIEFAPIDARDGIVGYHTVGVVNDRGVHYFPATDDMYTLCERMEAEYLTRLHSLQEEIRAKYLPLVAPTGFTQDYTIRNVVEERMYEEVRQKMQDEFPGKMAHYYT